MGDCAVPVQRRACIPLEMYSHRADGLRGARIVVRPYSFAVIFCNIKVQVRLLLVPVIIQFSPLPQTVSKLMSLNLVSDKVNVGSKRTALIRAFSFDWHPC